eukprot:Gb_30968 [translate_table: standard]
MQSKNKKVEEGEHSTMNRQSFEITRESDLESQEVVQRGNSLPSRGSISLSRDVASRLAEEIESERVAEAGDDGGRSLHGSRRESYSRRESNRHETYEDNNTFNIELNKTPDDALIFPYPFQSSDGTTPDIWSPISPLPSDIISPPSDHPLLLERLHADTEKERRSWRPQEALPQPQEEVKQKKLWRILEYTSILIHLAVFGIIGVLARYSLQILFGPDVAKVTNDLTPLYIDLPSNMVGSFFMGWVGVVFKSDISHFSEFLAIGLSTGLMGSTTTFTSWIQKMINLTTKGHWVVGLIGLLLGMELAQMSLSIGIETAKFFKWIITRANKKIGKSSLSCICVMSPDNFHRRVYGFILFMTIGGILWGGSLVLSIIDFDSHHRTKIWLACVLGPGGVWARWFLARLNGQGIGSRRSLKWLPIGTLLTNLIATCFMAALSIIDLVVKTKNEKMLIGGFELGFLGCMSTISTFVVEVHAMHQSSHPWRAYLYISLTLFPAFTLGTLIYSIPVWARGYSQT